MFFLNIIIMCLEVFMANTLLCAGSRARHFLQASVLYFLPTDSFIFFVISFSLELVILMGGSATHILLRIADPSPLLYALSQYYVHAHLDN